MYGFSDASERAYAAAVYAVLHTSVGISLCLITAKAKVAPIKVLSLPRLELCGAHLLSRLISYILESLDRKPVAIQCWTDYEIVLAWLQAHPSRWKSFVANRVSEIVTSLPTATWSHVCSADNLADLGSSGVSSVLLWHLQIFGGRDLFGLNSHQINGHPLSRVPITLNQKHVNLTSRVHTSLSFLKTS